MVLVAGSPFRAQGAFPSWFPLWDYLHVQGSSPDLLQPYPSVAAGQLTVLLVLVRVGWNKAVLG